MSDIFISYSKADHALALKLSAFLEAEGWSVWWDKSLGAADLYRDEIMKQLAASRTVITIWTPSSVKSDWVRAEAGRAKAEGKLIPVKTADVAYADIPLPFGEMHTENVASTDLIRAAIVAQLAKPSVPSSPLWQITSAFKYNVLTLIGIVGSVITLFANLKGVLDLADWAKELVDHWHELSQVFWGWVFSLIKVKVPTEFVLTMSFTVFTAALLLGVKPSLRAGNQQSQSAISEPETKVMDFVVGVAYYILALFIAGLILPIFPNVLSKMILYVIVGIAFPICYLLYHTRQRSWVLASSMLFLVMGICLLAVPGFNMMFNEGLIDLLPVVSEASYMLLTIPIFAGLTVLVCYLALRHIRTFLRPKHTRAFLQPKLRLFSLIVLLVSFPLVLMGEFFYIWYIWSWFNENDIEVLLELVGRSSPFVLFQVFWMAVILFSPLPQLTRRLAFVVLGVLLLIGLSEIPKLNLHQYLQPPKVSDNSVR